MNSPIIVPISVECIFKDTYYNIIALEGGFPDVLGLAFISYYSSVSDFMKS